MNSLFPTVGVCGTGAMGQGIAQMAAQAGSQVLLFDAATERAVQAQQAITAQWQKMLDKQRITAAQHQSYLSALKTVDSLQALSGCDLVVDLLRHRNSGRARQILLCLAGRAHWLPGLT
jgi:3-hydroxybutyryl-CoA dehydrogenase